MVTQARLLLGLTVFTALISGCAMFQTSRTVLHPIDQVDIQKMTAGVAYTPSKNGYFLSEIYLKEVVDAQVEEKSK